MAGLTIRTLTLIERMRFQLFVARNMEKDFPNDARALGMIWALKNLAEDLKIEWHEIDPTDD